MHMRVLNWCDRRWRWPRRWWWWYARVAVPNSPSRRPDSAADMHDRPRLGHGRRCHSGRPRQLERRATEERREEKNPRDSRGVDRGDGLHVGVFGGVLEELPCRLAAFCRKTMEKPTRPSQRLMEPMEILQTALENDMRRLERGL